MTIATSVDAGPMRLIDAVVAASPDDLAVRDADGSLTYGELSARADIVARRLVGLGVGPGDLVGLCLERSRALIVAALGIFRAGAAYVAIDPAYPEERLRWMLDDAVATITDAATTDRLPGTTPTVVLRPGGCLRAGAPDDSALRLPPRPAAEDLAYVVYTSGSTGRPKGAMIDHAGLLNLVAWHRHAFGLGAGDRCTQFVSPGFDAAVLEIWPALASGAALEVVPAALRADPIGLRDWLLS